MSTLRNDRGDKMITCPKCDMPIEAYDVCGQCSKPLSRQKYVWCLFDEENTHFCSAACMRKYCTEVIRDAKVELEC